MEPWSAVLGVFGVTALLTVLLIAPALLLRHAGARRVLVRHHGALVAAGMVVWGTFLLVSFLRDASPAWTLAGSLLGMLVPTFLLEVRGYEEAGSPSER